MAEILDKIDSPENLNEMSTDKLYQLAEEIRKFLIK